MPVQNLALVPQDRLDSDTHELTILRGGVLGSKGLPGRFPLKPIDRKASTKRLGFQNVDGIAKLLTTGTGIGGVVPGESPPPGALHMPVLGSHALSPQFIDWHKLVDTGIWPVLLVS